jgi:hypothetical protein
MIKNIMPNNLMDINISIHYIISSQVGLDGDIITLDKLWQYMPKVRDIMHCDDIMTSIKINTPHYVYQNIIKLIYAYKLYRIISQSDIKYLQKIANQDYHDDLAQLLYKNIYGKIEDVTSRKTTAKMIHRIIYIMKNLGEVEGTLLIFNKMSISNIKISISIFKPMTFEDNYNNFIHFYGDFIEDYMKFLRDQHYFIAEKFKHLAIRLMRKSILVHSSKKNFNVNTIKHYSSNFSIYPSSMITSNDKYLLYCNKGLILEATGSSFSKNYHLFFISENCISLQNIQGDYYPFQILIELPLRIPYDFQSTVEKLDMSPYQVYLVYKSKMISMLTKIVELLQKDYKLHHLYIPYDESKLYYLIMHYIMHYEMTSIIEKYNKSQGMFYIHYAGYTIQRGKAKLFLIVKASDSN